MKRILVCDDEPHITRMTQRKLESSGYEVVVANNGADALERMEREGPFDALVTDYNMPKMDGRELCEAVRERFAGEEIFIFLVTARLEDSLRLWAESVPGVRYIEKPLSLRILLGQLEKCFSTPSEEF